MLFSLLVNPLTGKDLDWADPSKHPSDPALGKAVINKCFTDYGDEDMVRACVNKYNGNRELMDPSLGGVKTLGNTLSMYHQPAQEWQCDIAPCWKRFGGVHSSDMAVTQIMERLLLEGFPKNTAEFRAVLSAGVQLQLVRVMM